MDIFFNFLTIIISVSLILLLIFIFSKKDSTIRETALVLPLPIMSFLNIKLLYDYLPDSYHVIKMVAPALVFISIAQIAKSFFNNKNGKIANGIFFIISAMCWAGLNQSILCLYRIPEGYNRNAFIAYSVVLLLLCIFFIRKNSFRFYFYSILSMISISFLHYYTILFCFYELTDYNIVRLIGSSMLFIYFILAIMNNTIIKNNSRFKELICFLVLFTASIMLSLSNIMVLS